MSRELLPSIRLFRIGEIWDKFQRPSYAGIRGEKGFDRSRRNPNKIFSANVYPGPCFNSNYPTQLRPRNFFPTIPPSPSLFFSISYHSGTANQKFEIQIRGKFQPRITLSRLYRGPSSMVEILGILSRHGPPSSFSSDTELWLNFPAIIGENRDGSPFFSFIPFLSPRLYWVSGEKEKFGVGIGILGIEEIL